jgi:adenylate cyclase
MPSLVIRNVPEQPRPLSLDKDVFSIGRSPENDLVLTDALVSRRHVEVIRQGTQYALRDLRSANGTYVNGARVDSAPLQSGDEVVIGSTVMVFEQAEAARPASPTVPLPGVSTPPAALGLPEDQRFDIRESLQSVSTRPLEGPADVEREKERFALLYQIGKAVLAAASFDDLLNVALSLVFDCIKAERGVLLLHDSTTGEMVPRLARHRERGRVADDLIKVPRTILNEVVTRKVSIITSDAKHDPRFRDGHSVLAYNVRSALCVPLWDNEQIQGIVYLDSVLEAYAFTVNDLALLSAIANLIAIRIRQERLHVQLGEERVVRANLERYHSPDVVDMILERARRHGTIELGVEEREVTILFADVQGFTLLSETREPTTVAALLNEFFDLSTDAIFEFGGTVNEYIGDSIMAIFGAPIDHPDHAVRAVGSALKILHKLEERRARATDTTLPCPIRVGINTGRVVVGNVGSVKRLKYTVLGDAVNVAARLEKHSDTNTITIGENTFAQVKGVFRCTDLGATTLRGRRQSLHVYRVEGPALDQPSPRT